MSSVDQRIAAVSAEQAASFARQTERGGIPDVKPRQMFEDRAPRSFLCHFAGADLVPRPT